MNGYKLLFRGSWLLYFLIFISGCGVAAMGAYYYQDEGHLIPAVQIEMYKNMPEDSPTLKTLREQAAKVPEGMLAAALKCAGKLGDQPNLATPPNAEEGNLDKKNSENVIKIIKDLVSHYKISFIVATHNLSIVKKFDKIIKLSEGKLI